MNYQLFRVSPKANRNIAKRTTAKSAIVCQSGSHQVSIWDAMKFNGPAPERVNSRLAMVALTTVAYHEHLTGQPALAQLANPSIPVSLGMLAITYATLVPILKGCKDEDFGIFSVAAEKLNGRAAMIGVALLLALENSSGVAFF